MFGTVLYNQGGIKDTKLFPWEWGDTPTESTAP
jgi:hypothetical protein